MRPFSTLYPVSLLKEHDHQDTLSISIGNADIQKSVIYNTTVITMSI
jgi:hypothetical protein